MDPTPALLGIDWAFDNSESGRVVQPRSKVPFVIFYGIFIIDDRPMAEVPSGLGEFTNQMESHPS